MAIWAVFKSEGWVNDASTKKKLSSSKICL
jgi:hypothetical protein